MIPRIKISTDGRYYFKIDNSPAFLSGINEVKLTDNIFTPIILRAKHNRIIDGDVYEAYVTNITDNSSALEHITQEMSDALCANPQHNVEQTLANILGYLFAKAIEQAIVYTKSTA